MLAFVIPVLQIPAVDVSEWPQDLEFAIIRIFEKDYNSARGHLFDGMVALIWINYTRTDLQAVFTIHLAFGVQVLDFKYLKNYTLIKLKVWNGFL